MNNRICVTLTALALVLSSCSFNPRLASQSEKNLRIQGANFRLNAAYEAFIGSIGLKRTKGPNRYELKFTPVWDELALKNTTKFDLSLAQELSRSFGVRFDANGVGGGSTAGGLDIGRQSSLNGKSSGKYHLLRVVDTKALVDQLNMEKNKELRQYIGRSKAYRVVTAVVIVYDHAASEKIENATNLTLSLKSDAYGNASVEAKSDGIQVTELSMSDGTIYAYEFSRFCWRRNAEGGLNIDDILLDRDIKKSDVACFDGSSNDPTSI